MNANNNAGGYSMATFQQNHIQAEGGGGEVGAGPMAPHLLNNNAAVSGDGEGEEMRENVYMSVHSASGRLGLAWYDASSGEMFCMETAEDTSNQSNNIQNQSLLVQLARLHVLPGTIYISSKAPESLQNALSQQQPFFSSAPSNDDTPPIHQNNTIRIERSKLFSLTSARPILESVYIRGMMPPNINHKDRVHIVNTVVNLSLDQQVIAVGALLYILAREGILEHDPSAPTSCFPLNSLSETTLDGHLLVDPGSLEALALFKEEHHPSAMGIGRSKEGLSVFGILDKCVSPPGKRLLRMWFARPVVDIDALEERMNGIEVLMRHHVDYSRQLRSLLKNVRDPLALLSRLERMQTLPVVQDIVVLQESISALLRIRESLSDLATATSTANAAHQLISSIIDPEQFPDSFYISYNISQELDEMKTFYFGLPDLLQQIQKHEVSRLPPIIASQAMQTWDVVYIPQIGFLLQVQGPLLGADILDRLPDIQFAFEGGVLEDSSISCACYHTATTQELTLQYGDVLHKIKDIESSILNQVIQRLASSESGKILKHAVHAAAEVDCLISLSEAALEFRLVRPRLVPESVIEIECGRHLLTEQVVSLSGGGTSHTTAATTLLDNNHINNKGYRSNSSSNQYIPNDTIMNVDSNRIHIITGPNYSGKSCYTKQVAIIVFLAHIGCFVPANKATIGITDRIFTRILSKQSPSLPQSSFMIDISQIATMIRLATSKSLLIIDEFGKGTLTSDGIGLLCGVLHHMMNRPNPPKVLLATHFMELLNERYLGSGVGGIGGKRQLAFFTMDVVVRTKKKNINRGDGKGDCGVDIADSLAITTTTTTTTTTSNSSIPDENAASVITSTGIGTDPLNTTTGTTHHPSNTTKTIPENSLLDDEENHPFSSLNNNNDSSNKTTPTTTSTQPTTKHHDAIDATPIEEVVFLYKLTQGHVSPSFGVHCARLAGLDLHVVQRAQHIISCISQNKRVERSHMSECIDIRTKEFRKVIDHVNHVDVEKKEEVVACMKMIEQVLLNSFHFHSINDKDIIP